MTPFDECGTSDGSRPAKPAAKPAPLPEPPPIVAPQDRPYPGVIRLQVDASDVQRGIFQVREVLPVAGPGPLTLLYPKWVPGYHSPQAPAELLAGLEITAGEQRLTWRRDPVEIYAFHLDVPEGVEALELAFQILSPTARSQGRVTVTPVMLALQWNAVLLYPAGHFVRCIQVEPTLTLPPGWRFGCALETARVEADTATFAPVDLEVLVDSPVLAGRHFRRVDLDDQGAVGIDIVADRADLLAATDDQIAPHRALVAEADRLFGSRPFDHFDFLLALSDELGAGGVEHRRSCEIASDPDYFTNWTSELPRRDVCAHEYVHAWNGKARVGADSWTPSFERPIRNSLMWVYEGQTQYWGHVLAARSGLWSPDDALAALARVAAACEARAGRRWRPMSDTTRDPIIVGREPLPWASWQRSEDYYSEGQLVWLDVDTLIRERSADSRSLDDFAATFFGAEACRTAPTYRFEDVVRALDAIEPYDWRGFLTERLESRGADAPLDGLARGGYRLVYRPQPSDFGAAADNLAGILDLRFCLGVNIGGDGTLQEVMWESPAFDAALTAGSQIVAVNGRDYGAEEIRQALTAAQDGAPIELRVKSGKRHRTVAIDYRGGLRFPHLEPIEGGRRRLDDILTSRR